MVCNAVVEMRRYYSRKVIDVLIKVIRGALDTIRRRFIDDENDTVFKKPIFALNAQLQIPNVVIKPNLDELQEILTTAGKTITGIAKGVAQWTSGKEPASILNRTAVYTELSVLIYFYVPLIASVNNASTTNWT